MEKATLSGLVDCQIDSVRAGTLERVMRLIGRGRAQYDLRTVFLSPEGQWCLQLSAEWMEHHYARLIYASAPRGVSVGAVEVELKKLLAHVKKTLPHEYSYLCNKVRARGHGDERLALALARILIPLLQHEASGFIERHWTEIGDKQLSAVIAGGTRSELALLGSGAPLDRVSKLTKARLKSVLRRPILRSRSSGPRLASITRLL